MRWYFCSLVITGGGGGGGGVTSVYVRLCPVLFGFYETTDVFFGTLADIDGHWRTWTDIGGLERTLADSDGHWRTQTDIGGLVLQRGGLPSEIAKQRGTLESKILCEKTHNVCPPRSAYALSFFGFYETKDVFFRSLADIDGHYRGTLESGL